MTAFWKKHKDRIIAGVIIVVVGGVILAIIPSKQLRDLLVDVWGLIKIEVHLSVYWLLLLFIAGFVLAFILFKLAVLFNKKLEYYTKDVVAGLIWEWDNYNFATSLMALCPKCEAELKFKESCNHTIYACFRCDFNKRLEFNCQNIVEVVRIEIEKRERTGEWKKAEKRIKGIKNKR